MKKAVVIYLSKKGKTKYFGEEIVEYLKEKEIDAQAISIHDATPQVVENTDYVLLGAWTHGLFVILQHPDKPYVEFVKTLPEIKDKKVGLFTTYKVATGSMFRKMRKPLNGKINGVSLILKSKTEELTTDHKKAINTFISE